MRRIKFSESIVVDCNATEVFDFTQDYRKRLQWDTFLQKAVLIDGAAVADKGVKAYCVAKNGLGMVTEYVTFDRPNVTAIKMTKGPFMFAIFLGSWRFKEQQPNKTEVTFLYSFTLRFPFLLFSGFIRRTLSANVRQRLADLKVNVEQ